MKTRLSPATIDRAANTYVCCLGRVLLQAAAMSSAGKHNVQTSVLAQQVMGTQSQAQWAGKRYDRKTSTI